MATENYLLSIYGTSFLSYQENVLCFQSAGLSSTDTIDSANDLINAFRTHLESLWLDCIPGSSYVTGYSAMRAFPKPSATAWQMLAPGSVGGNQAGSAGAVNVCPAVHLIPPMGTKTGGRVFMPAPATDQVVNNAYDAAYVAAIDALFANALSGAAGSGTNWKLAIYSRVNQSASLALAYNLSNRIGFQGRRRKPVGGV